DPGQLSLENWDLSGTPWPTLVTNAASAGRIAVVVDGTSYPVGLADPGVLDPSLWQSLFDSTTTMVTPHTYDGDQRTIRSYSTGAVADHIHSAYLSVAKSSPRDPVPIFGPGGPGTGGDVANLVGELSEIPVLLHGSYGDVGLPFTGNEDTYTFR